MIIKEQLLSVNEFTRSGKALKKVMGIILHWTGPNGHNANQIWNYFENDCPKEKHYSSANYIIDFTGEIIHCIPDNEMAYHCGSTKPDPISGKIYTDWARSKFGYFADSKNCSPNQATIGIEMCAVDSTGVFRDATISAGIELVFSLCSQFKLGSGAIGTHNIVVGWKDCPRLWVNKPNLFDAFIEDIKIKLGETNGETK